MSLSLRRLSFLALVPLAVASCTKEVNDLRVERFASPPLEKIAVRPSAVSVSLKATPAGKSLTPASLDRLNAMLHRQGRLQNQTLTLLPSTPAGQRMADRLVDALERQGLSRDRIRVNAAGPRDAAGTSDDLLVVSEAMVAEVPRCGLADPDAWTVAPFSGMGTLGCANRANLARMVSDPRDLVRPRVLAPGDGIQSDGAVQRYHENDLPDLIDIDFNNEDD